MIFKVLIAIFHSIALISAIFLIYILTNISKNKTSLKKEKIEKDNNEQTKKRREKIKETINLIQEKIELYEQVLNHIENGGAATGLVWEISPYMTKESTKEIILELKDLKVYLMNIYSEMMINQELEEIDEELKDLIKFEFETFRAGNLKRLEENLNLIEKKYNLK